MMEKNRKFTEPFHYLEYPRKSRPQRLRKLIADVINKQMVFLIVKTRRKIFEEIQYRSLRLAKGRGFIIYGITGPEEIPKGVNLLVGISLWHKPLFHILVGYPDLMKKLLERCSEGEKCLIDEIERDLESDIIGFVDPVDDVLECYGEDPFKTIIYQQSKM